MEIFLSDPISAECPCGPDLEYDPEYLLLFTRAAPHRVKKRNMAILSVRLKTLTGRSLSGTPIVC